MSLLNCFFGGAVDDHVPLSFSSTEKQRHIIYRILQNYKGDNDSASSFASTTLTCEHYFNILKVLETLRSLSKKDDSSPICEKAREKITEHESQRDNLKDYFCRVVQVPREGTASEPCQTVTEKNEPNNEKATAEVSLAELQSKLEKAAHLLKTTEANSEAQMDEEINESLIEVIAFKTFKQAYFKARELAASLISVLSLNIQPPLWGCTTEGGANVNAKSLQSTNSALRRVVARLKYYEHSNHFFL